MDLHLQERVMVKEKNKNKGKEVKVKASLFIKTKRSDSNLIVCSALVILNRKGRSAEIPFRYPREVYMLLDFPYPDMDEIND